MEHWATPRQSQPHSLRYFTHAAPLLTASGFATVTNPSAFRLPSGRDGLGRNKGAENVRYQNFQILTVPRSLLRAGQRR